MNPYSPVALARDYVSSLVQRGDVCVDCTTGNGYDTELLARLVSDAGSVIGFDIQEAAIRSTRERLGEAGLFERVELIHDSHATMSDVFKLQAIEEVNLFMFNLGYLPGSDKVIVTQASSTIDTLNQAAGFLKKGGAISIIAYRGHEGGNEEFSAVLDWINELHQEGYEVFRYEQLTQGGVTPVFLWIRKR